ncbi:MAG: putative PEP-binding protein [Coleofasciculaceae cyanobacterium]
MEKLYWLDEIKPSEYPLVGDRAFNLSQLSKCGYPVLPGFVVPATAFWEFLKILGESEPLLADLPNSDLYVDLDDPSQLQLFAQRIRRKIMAESLTPAWASALWEIAETQPAAALNLYPSLFLSSSVKGMPTGNWDTPINLNSLPLGIWEPHFCFKQPAALELALKQVWAELFRARSLFYLQRNGISLEQLDLAVLVQPTEDAIVSGTIEANPKEWNILSSWGVGIVIAKGEVLPDSYKLEATTGKVIASKLGSKARAYRLSDKPQASSLSENGLHSYLLSEDKQKKYALSKKYQKLLVELCQSLAAELSRSFYLEWTICPTPDSSEAKLYIKQFYPQQQSVSYEPEVMPPHQDLSSFTPQLARGLPAAAGQVEALAKVITSDQPNLETDVQGVILVARSITPDWLTLLKQAAGLVTEEGGMTSHAAIIARELGIPAVVGVAGITQIIKTGEPLLVDGEKGEILRLAIRNSNKVTQTREINNLSNQDKLPIRADSPSIPINSGSFPIATQLLVNLSQPDSLTKIVGLPLDGVGLLRSELMMLNTWENLHPDEWLRQGRENELVEIMSQLVIQFAAAFMPRPVLYRSIDWRTNEFPSLSRFTTESSLDLDPERVINPIIGKRGIRPYLIDPTWLDLELAALGRVLASGYTNVHLMLPFVRTVEEFSFCRQRAEQVGLTKNPNFQIWIMAEVPSVLFLLPDYVKAGVQGISIGSNDLTQLLLAADRDQEELFEPLDARHPVVMQAIKQLIEMAKSANIPCSICGQAPAQYPELIDSLVQWGITSISVDVNDVENTYRAIARAEQRLLLAAARQITRKDSLDR